MMGVLSVNLVQVVYTSLLRLGTRQKTNPFLEISISGLRFCFLGDLQPTESHRFYINTLRADVI